MPIFRVTVELDYFVKVDSPEQACRLASYVVRDIDLEEHAYAEHLDEYNTPCEEDPAMDSLVYGPDEDITLREALYE
jgi:hypothetical protein